MELLLLLERECAVVSSVSDSDDADSWFRPHASEILKQVSLAEHASRVLSEMVGIIPPTRLIEYRLLVIAILGADISNYLHKSGGVRYHPVISAAWLRQFVGERLGQSERDAVSTAVWTHHIDISGSSPLCAPLRRAQMRARAAELDDISPNLPSLTRAWREIPVLSFQMKEENFLIPPTVRLTNVAQLDCSEIPLGWLDIGQFLKELDTIIDRCPPGDLALSTRKGPIYFAPHTLYRVFRRFALCSGWSSVLLYDSHPFERQRLMKALILKLYEANAILGEYPAQGFFSKIHVVQYRDGHCRTMPLIVFWGREFPLTLRRLALPKPGWLATIEKIWPIKVRGDADNEGGVP
ncbi:hypothetical protein [Geobacter grbiciae]|uniref:hypothetical protein n=1 Tax=Geobacter grbiciae TaxID=155042 RepID=UPI001C009B70|nr:hypothetical protein [Geobacter grbiciae]MBT1073958.1 hypothetical protein [Geobacter grbiciae]